MQREWKIFSLFLELKSLKVHAAWSLAPFRGDLMAGLPWKRPFLPFLRVSGGKHGVAEGEMLSAVVGNPMKERERDGVTRHVNSPLATFIVEANDTNEKHWVQNYWRSYVYNFKKLFEIYVRLLWFSFPAVVVQIASQSRLWICICIHMCICICILSCTIVVIVREAS